MQTKANKTARRANAKGAPAQAVDAAPATVAPVDAAPGANAAPAPANAAVSLDALQAAGWQPAAMGAPVAHVALLPYGVNAAQADAAPAAGHGAPMLPRVAYAMGAALRAAGKPVEAGQAVTVAALRAAIAANPALRLDAGHAVGSAVAHSPKHARGGASHKARALDLALPLASVVPYAPAAS